MPPASDIGSDLVFNADGVLPAIISLEAGKSVDVVFKTDGSGSLTMRDSQVDLEQIYSSVNACTPSDVCSPTTSGGGGSPSLLLFMLLCIPAPRANTIRLK